MVKEQLYFRNVDHTFTESLQDIIDDAKREGLSEITVIKAVPDDGTTGMVWCTVNGECIEKSECRKSQCSSYESNKSGRGACIHRGSLYLFGEEVIIKIDQDGI